MKIDLTLSASKRLHNKASSADDRTVDEPSWWCPIGDGKLVRTTENGVHQTCDGCRGFAVTIWLLDELLVDGAGGTIWRSSAQAPRAGDPCPACRAPMARVQATGGATVEVCRSCEVVWVSAEAQALLPGRPELQADPGLAATHGIGSPEPTHCPNCGAPFSETIDGCCPYCREAINREVLSSSAPELAARVTAEHAREGASAESREEHSEAIADAQIRMLDGLANSNSSSPSAR